MLNVMNINTSVSSADTADKSVTSDKSSTADKSSTPDKTPSIKSVTDSDYLGNIDNYYTLKYNYENALKEKISKVKNNKNLTDDEIYERVKNMKGNCVNCKRDVGTLFDIRKGTLIAICGDTETPCNLDIKIQQKPSENVVTLVKNTHAELEPLKQQVIVDKMNSLFGYGDVKRFEKDIELVNETFLGYLSQLEYLDGITHNVASKIKITSMREQIQTMAADMKELIVDGNRIKYQIYVDQYINQILPMISEIRQETGKIMYMDRDGTGEFRLIKVPYNPEELDVEYYTVSHTK